MSTFAMEIGMPRREQDPEVTVEAGARKGATTYKHPAYGQITLSKVHGLTTLYGSDFQHHNWVEITLHESQFTRNLSQDWPYAGRELVSLRMSEAQWAAFVSSAGLGGGVQCTLDHVMGDVKPSIPYRNADEEHKPEVADALRRGLDMLAKAREQVEASGLSKAKQGAILADLDKARQELTMNVDFVAESYGKAMEDRTEKAKVEINAYITSAVTRAGLTALQGGESSGPISLPSP